MTEQFYNEEKLRSFLFGEMPEAERAAIEVRFLANEDFSEQIQMVEGELIEAYLRGELSPTDHKRFAAAFLTNPRRLERVVVMKGVLAAANAAAAAKVESSPSRWTNLPALFRLERGLTSYAAAAVILVALSFGGWLLFKKLGERQNAQLAQQNGNAIQTASPAAVSPLPSTGNSQPSQTPLLAETPAAPGPTPVPKPPAGPTLASIMLRPALVRDPAAANKLTIAPSVTQVRVQLNLERNDYSSYAVRITTVDGHLVWQAGSMRAGTLNRPSITVAVPARLLPTDDYLVEVSGVNAAGPPESLANYFFSVTRK
ncbi:MAG: hypothetical protein ABI596_14270 [Pyrinomonadaceae bacterium]